MKKIIGYLPLIGVLALASLGCSDSGNNQNVIAKVGEREITEDQFNAYLKHKRVPFQDEKRKERELSDYLEREAVADAIASVGDLDTKLIQAKIREYEKQLLISEYFQKYLENNVTDQAVKNFYNSNIDKYEAKKIHVAHILIRTNEKMSEDERQALLSKAGEVYSYAVRQHDFAELAKKYSEDKISGKNGGDLGWLPEGAIHPVFSSTAFSMKAGDISKPIATNFGYHIIKVIEDAKMVRKPFEAVEGDIRYQLQQQSKNAERERLKGLVDVKRAALSEEDNG